MSEANPAGAPPVSGSGLRGTLVELPMESGLRELLAQAGDWYWETDPQLHLTQVRGRDGALDHQAFGQWSRQWERHRTRLQAHRPFADLVIQCESAADECERALAGTGEHVAQLCGAPLFEDDGSFLGYAGLGRDVSEQYRLQVEVQGLASQDPLTRVLNRQVFDTRAQQLLADAYTRGTQCALLCVGLDDFRLFNSTYGYRVGDRMLAVVADRIREAVPVTSVFGRRGGDEIVVLLVNAGEVDASVQVARDILAAVSAPARVGTLEVAARASVGIASFPRDGGDLEGLLNAAEAALLRAKRAGGGMHATYTAELARRAEVRVRLEQRLRKAYQSRDFRLVYQPLVALPDGELIGAEALVRWNDAEMGDIEPAEFVPIAEQSGLIEGLGEWVLREACRQRQLWRQIGLELPPIAINISGLQLRNPALVDAILLTLDEFEVSTGELEIEITETGLIESADSARETLARLRGAGIKAALDDFGVGYSSLAHLRDLPMYRLKIDRSFTLECMRDARTLTIVKSVVDMAHNLGLTVTAEGIETAEQKAWMHHLGCDSAQGYYFARPMAAEDFLRRFLDAQAGAPSKA
jgi:diguanylate cyclase (GGDEF)-like protein